jgi:hypothetical protein
MAPLVLIRTLNSLDYNNPLSNIPDHGRSKVEKRTLKAGSTTQVTLNQLQEHFIVKSHARRRSYVQT